MSLPLLIVNGLLPIVISLFLLWRVLGGWSAIKQNDKVARFGRHTLAIIPLLIGGNFIILALALNDPFYVLAAIILGVMTWSLVFFIVYKNTAYSSVDVTSMGGSKSSSPLTVSPTPTVSKGAKL